MRHVFCLLSAALTCLAMTAGSAQALADAKAAPGGPEGTWEGTLKIAKIDLRLALHFSRKGDKLSGTLDSIDQGAKGIAMDTIEVKDRSVRVEWKALKAVFQGKLTQDGTALEGRWEQSGLDVPITFRRTAKATELVRPQHPKRPYPYKEEEVTFENKKAGVKFSGTLTVPRGEGAFPAVVLLSGSGPQDRDETLFGHKPFLVLADYLTRRGIAVLRVDDRGVGGSTGDTFQATLADHAGDALAAVAYLKGRKDINAKQIGLLGHSEGGIVAPLAATKSKDVAFLILLAGTGLPGEQILYAQGQAIAKALGFGAEELARQRQAQEAIFGALRQEKDNTKAKKLIQQRLAEIIAKLPEEEQKKAKEAQGLVEGQLKVVLTPWFRAFLDYDPRPALRQVQVPVLALTGEKDLQVLPKENLKAIADALKEGGNQDYTVKELPNLNHLFQTCKTGSLTEYGRIEETFAPSALALIGDWIVQRTKNT